MQGKLKKEDWGWVVEFDVNEGECLTRSIIVRPADVTDLIYDEYWGSNVHNTDVEFEIVKQNLRGEPIEYAKLIKR